MRRIVLLLTVVALMVGMLAMSVAPAFAYGRYSHPGYYCYSNPGFTEPPIGGEVGHPC